MSKQSDLVEDLKLFGLSEYESRAFLEIVRMGSATAPKLAEETKIPQAKIYGVLEDLSNRGFVYKDENKKPAIYFADKPIKRFKEFLKQFTDASTKVSDALEQFYETAGGAHKYGFYSAGNFTEKQNIDDFIYIFAKDDSLFKKFFTGKKVKVDGIETSHNFFRVGGISDALVAFARHRMIILIDKGDRVQFVSIEDPIFAQTIDQLMALSSINRSLTTEMLDIQQLEDEKMLYLDSIHHAEGTVFGEKGTLWISNKRFFLKIPGKDTYAVPIFAIESCTVNPEGRLELNVKGRERAEEITIYPESDSSIIANLISFILENGK
jgi:predicted transcriptional regulator